MEATPLSAFNRLAREREPDLPLPWALRGIRVWFFHQKLLNSSLCSLFRIFVDESCRQTRCYLPLALVTGDLEFRFSVNIFLPIVAASLQIWSSCVCVQNLCSARKRIPEIFVLFTSKAALEWSHQLSSVCYSYSCDAIRCFFNNISITRCDEALKSQVKLSSMSALGKPFTRPSLCLKTFQKKKTTLSSTRSKKVSGESFANYFEKLNMEGKVAK